MDCMKCRRQTRDGNVFCPDCLAEMAKYPVKSDAPVILPQRKDKDRKAPQKKALKPEELLLQLQQKLKRLWIAAAVLGILLTAASGALAVLLVQQHHQTDLGSNYSTYSSTEASTGSVK